jgi:hypothetical protein
MEEKRDLASNSRLAWCQAEASRSGGRQQQLEDVARGRSSSSKWASAVAAQAGDRQQELGAAGAAELSHNHWVGSFFDYLTPIPQAQTQWSMICKICKILVTNIHPGIKGTACYFLGSVFATNTSTKIAFK